MKKNFHERFEITIGIEDAKRRFVNRFYNVVNNLDYDIRKKIAKWIAHVFGEKYKEGFDIEYYVKDNFYSCLHAIEIMYEILMQESGDPAYTDSKIDSILSYSELDLGVKWEEGIFMRSGAKLLDEKLVNESLSWLKSKKYKNVYNPFEKGLSHFLKADKNTKFLYDVIRDMYESLEALAKIVTGRTNKDLSANAESFIKKVKTSKKYKAILKEYINYANEFRHALEEGKERPPLSIQEVESFIYLTGLFIRLAIEEK